MHEPDLAAALHTDHRHIDVLLAELSNRVHADDRALVIEAWTALERALRAHIEAEDLHMIPLLEREAPEEARALLAEHAEIRRQLANIGFGLELSLVSEEVVARFAQNFRNHAAREDELLYLWAEVALDDGRARTILEHLDRARRAQAA